MKKMNNKGFSLVELIVVIAIMAVLMGVLAPALIGNIEKSRESKDLQNLDTVYGRVNEALSNDAVSKEVSADIGDNTSFTYALADLLGDSDTSELGEELRETIGNLPSLTASCNADENAAIYVTITEASGNKSVVVFVSTAADGDVIACDRTEDSEGNNRLMQSPEASEESED